jgi:CTP-dependent riboflavin kinase
MRIIVGRVACHEEGYHVATELLNPVVHLIEERMGLADLVAGTLNVHIPEDYIVIADASIAPNEYGHNEMLKFQRCIVEGYKAIIMRPDTHETIPGWGHGKNHFELMGQIHFRDTLGLVDGSHVRLELEGGDDWWASGS